jgi:alkanesulfonate monooxygenase SsuD/methylene tetrahydromethanopterin reductase-like flavin-dependent oxidoreductase (luciferase family)
LIQTQERGFSVNTPIFGLDIPAGGGWNTAGPPRTEIPAKLGQISPVDEVIRAESLGFDFVSVNDHMLGEPLYEGWTLLTWLAAVTSNIRVVPRVIGLPYREPAVLAKMAETLDRLSDGRLILGLGAGSGDEEYRAMGLPDDTVGMRISALEEAIKIIRGLWSQPEFTFEGHRYRTDHAILLPKPEHQIPIWLGTERPRALRLTGQTADGWFPSFGHPAPTEAAASIAALEAAAREAGRDPSLISKIYNIGVSFSQEPQADLVGSPRAITERLIDFWGLGFTGFNFKPYGDRQLQVERLAEEVLPAVRETLAANER